MAKNYTYPRVSIMATAKNHSSVAPAAEDTTVLFAPIMTEKGPEREVVRVHSLTEFIETFGNLNYERNGQMALNVYNWLTNGGTVYVFRLAGYSDADKKAVIRTSDVKTHEKVSIGNTQVEKFSGLVDIDYLDKIFNESKEIFLFDNTALYGVSYNAALGNGGSEIIKRFDKFNKIKFIPEIGTTVESDSYFYSDDVYEYKYKYTDVISGKEEENTVYRYYPATIDEKSNTNFVSDTRIGSNGLFIINVSSLTGGYYEGKARLLEYDKEIVPEVLDIGSAKYFGIYYNDLSMVVTMGPIRGSIRTFNIEIKKVENGSTSILERFYRLNPDKYKSALVSSEYISADGFDPTDIIKTFVTDSSRVEGDSEEYFFVGAEDAYSSDAGVIVNGELTDSALMAFYESSDFSNKLANTIETPIDIMLDAGYPMEIKMAMLEKISSSNSEAVRPDIIGIFDRYQLKNGGYFNVPEDSGICESEDAIVKASNIALYDQYFTISDAMFTDQNIYVTPTYFLSKLIAYNDMNYGIQFPTAGIRRGVLDDALSVNMNPNADQKEDLFRDRINYVEKTPREYAFMNQRTHDGSTEYQYTALSFLNNVRVVEKMKKELERIGRSYLFEFNDSITLSQLSDVMNKYVMNWVANRTLATAVVSVEKNPWSDEAVDVTLTIRFNGTIEVISVQITIE